jgi:DNA topoisomerase II
MTEPNNVKSKVKIKDLRSHVLSRPDMYFGGIEPIDHTIIDYTVAGSKVTAKIANEPLNLSGALPKLVGEALSNMVDEMYRNPTFSKNIAVIVDSVTGEVTCRNDGGIPIIKNEELGLYDPEIVFSIPMSGTNLDDEEERDGIGGRNGYGAKLLVIMSKRATVETCDGFNVFKQTWVDNMSPPLKPAVVKPAPKAKQGKPYTEVKFLLDYERLGITNVTPAVQLITDMVWQMCATTPPGVIVKLNGNRLPIKSFKQFAQAFGNPVHAEDPENRIEMAMIMAGHELPAGVFGFVNSLLCREGTHVAAATHAIRAAIGEKTKQKCKPPVNVILNNVLLLVRVQIDKPTFNDQSKTKLTKKVVSTNLKIPPAKVSDLTKRILSNSSVKDEKKASRVFSSDPRSIPKYESAGKAGTRNIKGTVVIFAEGDSANGFAVDGLSVVGRELFGTFALRGKIINVRGEKDLVNRISNNVELASIVRIVGPLTEDKFRYSSIAILSDQDKDGGHIAGLLVNFIEMAYPKRVSTDPTFIKRIATPIIKVRKGGETHEFMTEQAFDAWWGPDGQPGWTVKYYKGLGTSTTREAKEVFSVLDQYMVNIDCTNPEHLDMLDIFFHSKRTAERKELITKAVASGSGHYEIDYSSGTITLSQLLMGEMVPYMMHNVKRHIPRVEDGLKPSQRKVVYEMLRDNKLKDIKINQLSGKISERMGYLHGEDNLSGTEVNLAKDHPLSNMINLLVPDGNYGNRHGNKAGSPRYIFTALEKITRAVFPADDMAAVPTQTAEGKQIEPVYLMPCVPLLLINGCHGVGSGWSVDIPSHDVREMVDMCRATIEQRSTTIPLEGWFPLPRLQSYEIPGERLGKNWVFRPIMHHEEKNVRFEDVPIATDRLFELKTKEDEEFFIERPYIKRSNKTDVNVDTTLTFKTNEAAAEAYEYLQNKAKLEIKAENMHVLTDESPEVPIRADTAQYLFQHFAEARLSCYDRRKSNLSCEIEAKIAKINTKMQVLQIVVDNPEAYFHAGTNANRTEYLKANHVVADDYKTFHQIPIGTFTQEEIDKLQIKWDELVTEAKQIRELDPWDMWTSDLDAFDVAYAEFIDERKRRRENPAPPSKKKGGGRKKANLQKQGH